MPVHPSSMQALVLRAARTFAVEDVPTPTALEADEVLCQVDTTFICGTDPHIINGDFPGFWPPAFPFIPGHEWSATVVDGGPRALALGWTPGQRVCAISHCGCGFCANCLAGRYNLCLNYGHPERGHRQYGHITAGAYAEYVRASVKSLVRVPDGFDLELAACVDPLSIALYTVKRSRLQAGDDLLVMGTGPQGLMAILCAKAMGAGRIIAVGSGRAAGPGRAARRAADRLSRWFGGRAGARPHRRSGCAGGGRVRRHGGGDSRLLPRRGQGRRRVGDRHSA